MSDLLVNASREPLQASFSDAANPLGLDGIEFIEYSTPKPQALGQVLEMMGFKPVARHRSREIQLYRQGGLNIVVNGHPGDAHAAGHGSESPTISAIALESGRLVLHRRADELLADPNIERLFLGGAHASPAAPA